MIYNPDVLLDTLILKFGLKNDAQLARKLNLSRPIISRIRNRDLHVSATVLIKMHEASGLSIKELRELMGDFRPAFDQGRLGQNFGFNNF